LKQKFISVLSNIFFLERNSFGLNIRTESRNDSASFVSRYEGTAFRVWQWKRFFFWNPILGVPLMKELNPDGIFFLAFF